MKTTNRIRIVNIREWKEGDHAEMTGSSLEGARVTGPLVLKRSRKGKTSFYLGGFLVASFWDWDDWAYIPDGLDVEVYRDIMLIDEPTTLGAVVTFLDGAVGLRSWAATENLLWPWIFHNGHFTWEEAIELHGPAVSVKEHAE